MSDWNPAILQAVDESLPEILDFTRELIAIPTENPPGNEYPRCAAAIVQRLADLGFEPEVRNGCVLAHYGAGDRALHFHGHYDVVPRSTDGQFEPVIEGANLFGRGSSDMKGGLAAMIYAARALQHIRAPLGGRIELVIVPDEETGGERGTSRLRQSFDFAKGSVGMLTAEPTSGVIWNANRGAISLRIRVKGKPAHVGLSYQGINAFERMLRIAREFEVLKEEVEKRETQFHIHPQAARRSILLIGGECRGGSNFNVVPEECSFTLDRRTNPEEDLSAESDVLFEILDRLRKSGIDHEVEVLQQGGASAVSEEHLLARTLAASIESVTSRTPEFEMCPGLLETRFYAERGVPALAYGPGLLSVSHGPREFVPIRNLRDSTAIYALTALQMLS
jgi:succinyl-diaminopimelate desuccinylase